MLASVRLQRGLMAVLVALVAGIVFVIVTNTGAGDASSSDPASHSPGPSTQSTFDGPTMPPHLKAQDFTLSDQYGRRMRKVWHAYAIQPVTPKVDHSTFVLLIDKHGYERVGFAADQLTPEGLAHDIRVLQRQS